MRQSKIYDIAGAAGVSLATVSRVINHPEKVKKETRDKVLAIINSKGYVPNMNARSLAASKTASIALVVPTLLRASVAEMVQGVYDAALKVGYQVKLFIMDLKDSVNRYQEVIASGIDGIIFMNDEIGEDMLNDIGDSPFPIVFVNTLPKRKNAVSVVIDYFDSAYFITRHFIDQGCKDILFINTRHYYQTSEIRFNGYKKAMEEAGLTIKTIETVGDLDTNRDDFKKYLASNPVPEAAIAVRDSMGISFMYEAIKIGAKVPEDLQVVGMQNTRYSNLCNPTLTCMEMPIYDIGLAAMQELKNRIENSHEKISAKTIVIPYKIVVRSSTR